MAKVKTLRVPREKIVRAARWAIEQAREQGSEVDRTLARRLMRTARTEPRFVLGGWYVEGRCGCLVGNLIGNPESDPEGWQQSGLGEGRPIPRDATLRRVGVLFDDSLVERLSPDQEKAYFATSLPTVLTVVD